MGRSRSGVGHTERRGLRSDQRRAPPPAPQRGGAPRAHHPGCVEVLADEGYRGASLARIAQAAGVSKGLVSHYFSDRDTLMEQTAIATVAEVRRGVGQAIDLSAPVPDVIRSAVHLASRLRRAHARELRAPDQIVHNLRDADGAPRLDPRAYEETYRAQEALFRRGQEEGSLRAFDPRVMAVTYQAAGGGRGRGSAHTVGHNRPMDDRSEPMALRASERP